MATFTSTAAQSNVPAVMSVNRTVTRVVQYASTIALSSGDVLQMVKVPNGCNVTRVHVAWSLSAGAIITNIGDGNDISAYYATTTISGPMVTLIPTFRGLGRSYSAEDTIDIVFTTVSGSPGTSKFKLTVDYNNQSGQ